MSNINPVTGSESDEIVLASASPRRHDLLRQFGFRVRVIAAPVDEPQEVCGRVPPTQAAEALSYFKACGTASTLLHGIVLAGDTIAALDGCVLGKPADRDDARRMLQSLSGTTHFVITGVTLLDVADGRRVITHDTTAVTMRDLSEQEIETYLDTGEWQGKAGAYGIQDYGDAFVTGIKGSFTNVVGLPMELVIRLLADWNVYPVDPDVPAHNDS